MRAVLEVLLSLLAVTGLVAVGWLCFGRLLTPAGDRRTCILVPASGDGEDLEQTVNGFLWLRSGGLLEGRIIILDRGLTAEGQALAAALCQREPEVRMCRREELPRHIE